MAYYHSVRPNYTGIFVVFGLSSHTPKALCLSHIVYHQNVGSLQRHKNVEGQIEVDNKIDEKKGVT